MTTVMPPIRTNIGQLVALQHGPKHGQWYTADDFTEIQAATRRTANEHTPPAALAILHYVPTGRQTTRHICRRGDVELIATADIYTYRPDGAA